MPQQFPEDPRIGQLFYVDLSGETAWMKQIQVHTDVDVVRYPFAEAQGFSRIPTSSHKYILKGVISSAELSNDLEIVVNVIERQILAYIFLEDCSWSPCKLGEPVTLFRRKGRIIQKPVLTLTSGSFNVFNEICVSLPHPDEDEEKEKTDEQDAQPA
jgi:hypothetical protein